MGEIIYEKHFHKETIEEIERERIDFVEAFGEDAEQAPSFDEIMKKIYSNVTSVSYTHLDVYKRQISMR